MATQEQRHPAAAWATAVALQMPQERDGAAHAALVQRLQVEHFAEDIEPPPEARLWSQDELTAFFESGGEARPLRCSTLDVQVVRMPSGRRARAFLISDMHCDHAQNLDWMRDHLPPRKPDCFDVVVCCGDVSDNLDILRRVLVLLRSRFNEVLFTPGNHELWANRDPDGSTSLHRLETVRQLCDACGVRTEPVRVVGGPSPSETELGGGGCDDVLFVPLHSWYHPSWDREPDLPSDADGTNRLTQGLWADHRRCRWPASLHNDETRAAHFAELNEPLVQALSAALPPSSGRAPPPTWDKRRTYAQYGQVPMTDELWTSIDAGTFFTPRAGEGGAEGGAEGGRGCGRATGVGGPTDQSENDGGSEADGFPAGDDEEGAGSGAAAGGCHGATGDRPVGRPFVISFSHFVPRQELLPEKRMLIMADLHKVSGSTHLEAQVRRLRSRSQVTFTDHSRPYGLCLCRRADGCHPA